MSEIDNRKKAFENKFAHDEELKFKIASRRRKMLGLWASEIMGLEDDKSLEYAMTIVNYGLDNKDSGAVIKKILNDITSKGVAITEQQVRLKNDEFEELATRQITS
ncbi:MAG: DUF1476 domain-containing protein [Rickettsiales bacterium]|nr:DUF1476 domain-containing protein [Rickettsiales bacterium]